MTLQSFNEPFLPRPDASLCSQHALDTLAPCERAWAIATETLGDAVWISRSAAEGAPAESVYASSRLIAWLADAQALTNEGEVRPTATTDLIASGSLFTPSGPGSSRAELEISAGVNARRHLRLQHLPPGDSQSALSSRLSAETKQQADPEGCRFAVVIRDISEFRQAEAALRETLAVQQRTREEAERLSASKDEFISIVSHDLRSPLNAIRGWAHVLKLSSGLLPAQERALDAIDRNITAQARMVDDLLDSQRILRGKLVLSFGRPLLADLVDEAVETIRVAAENKRITIDVLHDRSIGVVEADVERLRQALSNILSNSLKFTPEDGNITVSTRRLPQSHGSDEMLGVTISDTGTGLTPEQLPHVFDPVMRADQPGGRRQGGLNLPLSLARQLIEMHGGHVAARSEGIDDGLTMVIDLPATQRVHPRKP